jgi:hypothetical protein
MSELYYPECDGHLFNEQIPAQEFPSDTKAVKYYKSRYGGLLMAVVKDNDPQLSIVYTRK